MSDMCATCGALQACGTQGNDVHVIGGPAKLGDELAPNAGSVWLPDLRSKKAGAQKSCPGYWGANEQRLARVAIETTSRAARRTSPGAVEARSAGCVI